MDKMVACGMEVSAQELVLALLGKKGEAVLLRFVNTAAGHRQLLRALTRGGKRVRVCMEATGMYGLDVALALSAQEGVELMVANPRAVRSFARAMMQRSKNDQLDAVVLREFAARMPFRSACGGALRGPYDRTSTRCNNCAGKHGAASPRRRACGGTMNCCAA